MQDQAPLFYYKLTTAASVEVLKVKAFVKKAVTRHFHQDGATSICLFASRMGPNPSGSGMNQKVLVFRGAHDRNTQLEHLTEAQWQGQVANITSTVPGSASAAPGWGSKIMHRFLRTILASKHLAQEASSLHIAKT